MELKSIETVLKKTSEGDFSVRIDESNIDAGLKTVAQLLNRTLEKAAVAKELKHRADVMIQYNPMAIAILRKDKTRIHINKAYETIWRGTRDELISPTMVRIAVDHSPTRHRARQSNRGTTHENQRTDHPNSELQARNIRFRHDRIPRRT